MCPTRRRPWSRRGPAPAAGAPSRGAQAHFHHGRRLGCAEELRFSATDFNSYVTVSTAEGAPLRLRGRMAASAAPGLGVEPRMEVLGEPVVEGG